MALMALERMRVIDTAHAWAPRTLTSINANLRRYLQFCNDYGLPRLARFVAPLSPPSGHELPLLWSMEHYTCQPSSKRGHEFVGFQGGRALRSAIAAYHSWSYTFLPQGYHNRDHQVFGPTGPSPTDSLLAALTFAGMERRLGSTSKPSLALRAEHIHWNIHHRSTRFYDPTTPAAVRYALAQANLCELFFWLGWLRATECFSLHWPDVHRVRHHSSQTYGLPPNTDALLLRLLEATKSNQTAQADLILAGTTASGLSPAHWYDVLLQLTPQPSARPLFCHPDSSLWSSHYFRHTHLYPLLHEQRLRGDPHLLPYDSTPNNSLADKFWGMNSYRRGGRSHTERHRPGCVRRATPEEITEHGRWRTQNRASSGVSMPTHYLDLSLEDRLYITLLCM